MPTPRPASFWLTNLPVQWKLASVIALLIAILLIVLGFNTFAIRTASDAQSEAEKLAQIINQSNVTVRIVARRQIMLTRLMFENNAAAESAYEMANADVRLELERLSSLVTDAPRFLANIEQASIINEQWLQSSAPPMLAFAEQLRHCPRTRYAVEPISGRRSSGGRQPQNQPFS